MTRDQAAEIVIEGMNYAAYEETDSSLYDSDKNRLFGSEHYNSGRVVVRPSPWEAQDFKSRMATLLVWANWLNHSSESFLEAQKILRREPSLLGGIVRKARRKLWLRRLWRT